MLVVVLCNKNAKTHLVVGRGVRLVAFQTVHSVVMVPNWPMTTKPNNMSEFSSLKLICVDCDEQFDWTTGEQEFLLNLKNQGLISSINQPKRCQSCRLKRNQTKTR